MKGFHYFLMVLMWGYLVVYATNVFGQNHLKDFPIEKFKIRETVTGSGPELIILSSVKQSAEKVLLITDLTLLKGDETKLFAQHLKLLLENKVSICLEISLYQTLIGGKSTNETGVVLSEQNLMAINEYLGGHPIYGKMKRGWLTGSSEGSHGLYATLALYPEIDFLIVLQPKMITGEQLIIESIKSSLLAKGLNEQEIMALTDIVYILIEIVKRETEAKAIKDQINHVFDNHQNYLNSKEKKALKEVTGNATDWSKIYQDPIKRRALLYDPLEDLSLLDLPICLLFDETEENAYQLRNLEAVSNMAFILDKSNITIIQKEKESFFQWEFGAPNRTPIKGKLTDILLQWINTN